METKHNRIPIGIKFYQEIPKTDLPTPEVRSYCEALGLLLAGRYNEGLLITEESLKVCAWGFVALGLRDPQNDIDSVVSIRYEKKNRAIFIFNADMNMTRHPLITDICNPDVVSITVPKSVMEDIVVTLGPENLDDEFLGQIAFSINDRFIPGTSADKDSDKNDKRQKNILAFNKVFASGFVQSVPVLALVTSTMKRKWMQRLMNYICLNHTAAMGMCLSTTAYPYRNGKANVMLSDPGAVGWGGFNPEDMTIGMPGSMYNQIKSRIHYVFE